RFLRDVPRARVYEVGIACGGRAKVDDLGPELRPEIREAVDGVVLEARLVRQEELPDLLQVFDREDALPLPFRAEQHLSVHELLQMIRERRLRDADGHLEFPERPLA